MRSQSSSAVMASDALAVSEVTGLPSRTDDDVLTWATGEERALVSENARDVARIAREWADAEREHAGIMVATHNRFPRKGRAYPGSLITALRAFVEEPPVSGDSWVWWLE